MKNKVVILVILIIAVMGLSIGFATYSSSLNISSRAHINADSGNYRLVFANNYDINNLVYGYVTPVSNSQYGGRGTINNSGDTPVISGLSATFDDTGESVSYSVYIVNTGLYTAYIKNINFVPVTSSFNECVAREGTSTSDVATACPYVYMTITIDEYSFSSNSLSLNNDINYPIEPGSYEQMTITLIYASNGYKPNGDFFVRFGNVQLVSSTNPATN